MDKIELKWYEKKQGIKLKQKISAEQKKKEDSEKRRQEKEEKEFPGKQQKKKSVSMISYIVYLIGIDILT